MPIIQLLIAIIIVIVLLWAVETLLGTLVPMDPIVKRLIQVVIVVAVLIWILREFALL